MTEARPAAHGLGPPPRMHTRPAPETTMSRAFPVIPPPSHSTWLLVGLLLVPLAVIAVTLVASTEAREAMTAMAIGLTTVAIAGALTVGGLRRRQVVLDGGQLVVKAAMFTHRSDVAALAITNARIVNLEERTELRPGLKTFGMSLPGFQAGWFRLRDRSRGFCLLTSRRRVLWLPTRSGSSLLLSLEQPQALLDALRTAAGTPSRDSA